MSVVIIAEKPDAARRIAEALAEKKSLKSYTDENKVTYYEFERNGKKHIVACAVGHLFNLAPAEKGWKYPIFSYTWRPSFEVNKQSAFSKKYFDVVKKLVEKGSDFIIATDYDTEGELIGYNVLRFLANKNDAKRMKFSTLTKDELIEAYEKISPHIDFGQLEAGLTRHELDWLWGINTTRALTLALKNAAEKGFAILSSGRVQSPTLAILLERELEIRKFKPKPYWELELHVKISGTQAVASYEKGKIWKKEEADKVLQACKGKDAVVKDIKKKKYKQAPPVPFNTTDLQAEAYQHFKFSPQQTMNIAESLYQAGYCVTGDTLVPLSDGRIITIRELVEYKNHSLLPAFGKNLKEEFCTVKKYWKIPYNGKLVEVVIKTNDKIKLTPDHQLLVLRDSKPTWIPAKEIKIGDFVAIPGKIKIKRRDSPSSILEVFELFNDKEKTKIIFKLKEKFVKIIKNRIKNRYGNLLEINKYFNYKPTTFYARFNRLHLSFDIIKWLLAQKIISKKELEKNTISYFWAAETAKPLTLPFYLTKDFCYFIGLIAADAHCSNSGVIFPNVEKLGKTVKMYLKKLKLGGWEGEKNIGFKSKLFVKILNHLGIPSGRKADKIDISNLILIQPDDLVWSYIAGFFDGDGSIKLKKTGSGKSFSIRIAFTSKSETFIRKLKMVLLSYGITSYIYQDDLLIYSDDYAIISNYILQFLRIRKKEWINAIKNYTTRKKFRHEHRLIPIDAGVLRKILEKNNYSSEKILKKLGIDIHNQILGKSKFQISSLKKLGRFLNEEELLLLSESDVIWKPVVKIEFKECEEKYVYDVTTTLGCFIGNSFVLHNCSYPRSASQKLPPSVNYEKILKALASLPPYKKFAEELLKKEKLVPVEGKKDDPAHPCFPIDARFSLNPHSDMSFKDLTRFVSSWEWDEKKGSYFGKISKPIKVLAFDLKNNKIISSFISGCWKTPFNKTLIKIITKSGNSIELTSNHLVMTFDATKGICFKEARELKNGDIIFSKVTEESIIEDKEVGAHYKKEGKEKHVSIKELPQFSDFDLSIPSGLIAEEIKEIKTGRKVNYVYDLEIEKYHTFFVNNFLVHNCIYATHEVPDLSKLTPQQRKIYDLIARRTLAVFGDEAVRETNTVSLDVAGHTFLLVGKRTLEPGWTKIYEPYLKREEIILPELKIGQTIKVIKLEQLAKETQPPARYSQGSIIKEMEARNLGTRATRAEILQTLYDRGYIAGKSIQVTKLGEAVVEALKEYCPKILSEELTRKFEEEMELVFQGKKKREEVVEEAKKTLKEILSEFKANEKRIGKKLQEALAIKREEERKLGNCPNCKTGELRILRSGLSGKFFVGCSNYPKCKTGYPLPAGASIQTTGNVCEKCNTPIIQAFRKGKRPFRMCLDPNCETKKDWGKSKKDKSTEE